ncbi:MAG: cell division protein SepF [Clostridia bacterium]|nr:cell division protein SepF [Clostridia bacterium]
MARKSGGFNKFLNFIGIVDEGDTNDTYGEEYQSDRYGRREPYVPNTGRQRPAGNTRQASVNQQSRRSLPDPQRTSGRYDGRRDAQGASSRSLAAYDGGQPRASRTYGGYEGNASQRRTNASRFANEAPAYDYSPRAAGGSRFDQEQPAPQPQAPRRNVPARTRTVMFSIHALEDCCAVIDELIANNTVVLTMDELEGSLMQRVVDTLSGAVFALSANIRKASDKTYLITPMSVEVNEAYDVERRF